jgi:lipoate-protein ligase A
VDFEACAALGWDVVRRPTPGRSFLYGDGLGYSLALPAEALAARASPALSGLLNGLTALGLEPARSRPYYLDRGSLGPVAFDGPGVGDIRVAGRTLIAEARLESAGVLLQQGIIPIGGDIGRIAQGMRFEGRGQRYALESRLGYRAITLELALGRAVTQAEVEAAIEQGFIEAMGSAPSEAGLRPEEVERAAVLRQTKYASQAWTERL